MKIVEPYARLVYFKPEHADIGSLQGQANEPMEWFSQHHGRALLRKIEWCGRISHRSEEAMTPESWKRFIPATVMGHGDWSIVEHATVSVDFLVDRGITHEIVRHRLFSFTHESTRFVNYEKKMEPSFIRPITGLHSKNTIGPDAGDEFPDGRMDIWYRAVGMAEEAYRVLVTNGTPPQIARSVFPNALASRLLMTGNLRNWRHFLIMRTTKEAHPQMRQVTIPLLEEFQAKIPLLFDDIKPLARQVDNLKLPR